MCVCEQTGQHVWEQAGRSVVSCGHAEQGVVLCMYVAGWTGCGVVYVNRLDRVWCCVFEQSREGLVLGLAG